MSAKHSSNWFFACSPILRGLLPLEFAQFPPTHISEEDYVTCSCKSLITQHAASEIKCHALAPTSIFPVSRVGQEILTLSGTTDFIPFGDFMISPFISSYLCLGIVFKGLRLVMWSLLHDTYQLREMLSADQMLSMSRG